MASSAARLRRSALAERARLQAEWAALKGPDFSSDVLRGVVALVSVAEPGKAAGLRAALAALGASVLQEWSPLVTHVIWGPDGCRQIRAKARALAARLVSPLWVEACASATRRLPEKAFPSATRPSDLPSPRTLRMLLRKADKENLPLEDIFNQSDKSTTKLKPSQNRPNRLRISSENDTSTSTSDSCDQSGDKSRDKSDDNLPSRGIKKCDNIKEGPDAKKSRRKLFTYKEGEDIASSSEDEDTAPKTKQTKAMSSMKLTQKERRDLARAERIARRLANAHTPNKPAATPSQPVVPRIAITGMSKAERQIICDAIRKLNGKLQGKVTKKTTHVILGSCSENYPQTQTKRTDITGIEPINQTATNKTINPTKSSNPNTEALNRFETVNPFVNTALTQNPILPLNTEGLINQWDAVNTVLTQHFGSIINKPRTINALEGAARGCKVLKSEWVLDSLAAGRWIYPYGYEVAHLKKVSERARIERTIFGFKNKEYAYDVFAKMRIFVSPTCDKKVEVERLLKLCGACVVTESGAPDITVGLAPLQINPRWVYDSIQAARPRTTRRYSNPGHRLQEAIATMSSNDFNAFMELDLS